MHVCNTGRIMPRCWRWPSFSGGWCFGHLQEFESHICVGESNNALWSVITFSADEMFESVGDRELRQVFEGQNRIHLEIKQLNRQLDMILDEQRRYVSSLTEEISKRGAGAPGQQGQVSLRGPWMCLRQGRKQEPCLGVRRCALWSGDSRAGWSSFVFPPDLSTRTGYCCEHSAWDSETSKRTEVSTQKSRLSTCDTFILNSWLL